MSITDSELSKISIYIFFAVGLFLFLVFRIVQFILPYILRTGKTTRFITKYFSFIELTVWMLFFIWSIQFFLETNHVYALLLVLITIILILFISWYALRDVIAGVIFKTNRKLRINDVVRFDQYAGTISRLTHRYIEIENEQGESIHIPFSQALSKVVIKKHPAEMIQGHTFKMNVAKKPSLKELIDDIKSTIIQMPWISLKREPIVKPVDQITSAYTFEITVYAIERNYFYKIEDFLRHHFEDAK